MKILTSVVFAVSMASLMAEPLSLFDGKSLTGWEGDPKLWRVEDGMITSGSLTEELPRNVFLATKRNFTNFELRLKLKVTGTGKLNSGVQIRSVRVPESTEMSGYQVDAGDGWWGKLYDESRRDQVISEPIDPVTVAAAVKPTDWNEYRIRAEGTRIQSWINGVPAIDFTEAETNIPLDGFIALQVHSGAKVLVQAKDLVIEELPPTPNAPTWEKTGMPAAENPAVAKP